MRMAADAPDGTQDFSMDTFSAEPVVWCDGRKNVIEFLPAQDPRRRSSCAAAFGEYGPGDDPFNQVLDLRVHETVLALGPRSARRPRNQRFEPRLHLVGRKIVASAVSRKHPFETKVDKAPQRLDLFGP
jgi:hypothetical protein